MHAYENHTLTAVHLHGQIFLTVCVCESRESESVCVCVCVCVCARALTCPDCVACLIDGHLGGDVHQDFGRPWGHVGGGDHRSGQGAGWGCPWAGGEDLGVFHTPQGGS